MFKSEQVTSSLHQRSLILHPAPKSRKITTLGKKGVIVTRVFKMLMHESERWSVWTTTYMALFRDCVVEKRNDCNVVLQHQTLEGSSDFFLRNDFRMLCQRLPLRSLPPGQLAPPAGGEAAADVEVLSFCVSAFVASPMAIFCPGRILLWREIITLLMLLISSCMEDIARTRLPRAFWDCVWSWRTCWMFSFIVLSSSLPKLCRSCEDSANIRTINSAIICDLYNISPWAHHGLFSLFLSINLFFSASILLYISFSNSNYSDVQSAYALSWRC